LVRVRHAPRQMPFHASVWCLRQARLTPDDIDVVAFGWDPTLQADAPEPEDDASLLELLLPRRWFPRKGQPVVRRVRHHQAHAAMGLAFSSDPTTRCVVIDGAGERESVSVWRRDGAAFVCDLSMGVGSSLGAMYQALSFAAGLGRFGGEGKAMGLAAHGKPIFEFPCPLEHPVRTDATEGSAEEYVATINFWVSRFKAIHGSTARTNLQFGDAPGEITRGSLEDPLAFKDLAASVQHRFELSLASLVSRATDAGQREVAFSGGAALNCLGIGRVCDRIGVTPRVSFAVDDGGVAIGAALVVLIDLGIVPKALSPYVGPSWSDGQLGDFARSTGLQIMSHEDGAIAEVAQRLTFGEFVGVFDGRMEFGPRALGARSLLAAVGGVRPDGTTINAVKRRQWWRPVGPVLSELEASRVFGRWVDLPFMAVAASVPEDQRQVLGTCVHVDGTTRPQVLPSEPRLRTRDILQSYGELTGHEALINTSLNIQSPIVCTPSEAVSLLFTSQMDALLLGPLLITK
jgi:carbamoyltransferase